MTIYYRTPWGKGFTYRHTNGKCLQDREVKRFINDLAIPPAWTAVQINTDVNAKIHVTGRDDANRKQYIYNPSFRAANNEEKFARILRFAKQLTPMRRTTGQHLAQPELSKEKVLACLVRLIDCAYFRPGNPHYTKENQTYGLLTLRSKHLTIDGDQLIFEYTGKSSKPQKRLVKNSKLKQVVKELNEVPGYEIFQYFEEGKKHCVRSEDLNGYIRETMGEEFSAKDFRTWAGTVVTAVALNNLGPTTEAELAKKNVLKAVRATAQKLGNSPTVARAHYIDPRVILHYASGKTLDFVSSQLAIGPPKGEFSGLHNRDEAAVIRLLELDVDKRTDKKTPPKHET